MDELFVFSVFPDIMDQFSQDYILENQSRMSKLRTLAIEFEVPDNVTGFISLFKNLDNLEMQVKDTE